jgi:hypothetical protein
VRAARSRRSTGSPSMSAWNPGRMPTQPEHQQNPFVRALRRALVEDARAEVLLALRVHALAERGHTNGQIAARLGASTAAVHTAAERLRRVRLLDRDDEP